ncbi:MAG: response regulator [Acidobacteria bacterium]|nr:response regulator [Acidobacteriota bacterium]
MLSRVLVVDDSPANLKLARVILEGEGYEVTTATDAVEALASIATARPGLILMDIQLPGMDGLELTRQLKADPATSGIPVLALTAYAMKGDDEKARSAGCDGYITKPFDTRALARTVVGFLAPPPRPPREPPDPEADPSDGSGEVPNAGDVGKGRRVLVIDDEALNRKLAEARLRLAGFVVSMHSAPESALAEARREPPDAVLSDILMPGMDGFQLCLALRADPVLAAIPIVLVSASYVEDADRQLARRVGADAMVSRTPGLERAIEALTEAWESRAAGVPAPVPIDAPSLEAAYRERLVWQLGRQLASNAELLQRSALHAATLAVVEGLGELASAAVEPTALLAKALVHALAATRLTTGLLYLDGPSGLRLHPESQLEEAHRRAAETVFSNEALFGRVLSGGKPVAFRRETAPPGARAVLERLSNDSLLLVPLANQPGEPGAILVFASDSIPLTDDSWLEFGRTLAHQLQQALTLARTLSLLSVSETRYRTLFERNLAGVARLNRDGSPIEMNPAALRMLGFASNADLLATAARPDARALADREALVARIPDTGEAVAFEHESRTGTGAPIWLHVNASLVDRGADGGVLELSFFDASESKRTEQRLRAHADVTNVLADSDSIDAALPRLLESLGRNLGWDVATFYVRSGGMLHPRRSWGEAEGTASFRQVAATMTLHSGEGLPGRVWAEAAAVWIEDLSADDNFPRKLLAANAALRSACAFPVIAQGQVLAVLELYSRARREPDPRLLKMFEGIGSQIAQFMRRREAEEALALQAQILDNLNDAVSAMDPVTHRIVYWNRGAERVYGHKRMEALGRTFDFLVPAESEANAGLVIQTAVERGTWSGEVPFLRKGGTLGTMDLLVVALRDESAKVTSIFGVGRDVSEKKLLEDQLRHAQKMEAVGQLAGGVAHDFNNILTAILGYSELLLSQIEEPGLREEIEEIRLAGERAASLTSQLLTFSRKQVVARALVDVNTIAAGMDRMLRRLIGEDIELVTRLSKPLGLVETDPGQIEQVILNLAVNARDAMPDGGKLTIETEVVHLNGDYQREHADVVPGNYVSIAVSDSGCGMDEATKARIFEPFFTTKEIGRGTGLGLATVYGIVKQWKGYIWVYSEVGLGTSFKIHLPIVQAPPAGAIQSGRTTSPRGTERVLLVEDEEMLRRLIRRTLESAGYDVVDASNGDAALKHLQSDALRPDIIVTDGVMPGLRVGELLRLLPSLAPAARVLIISGYTDEAVVRHGILDAGLPFLQKPFSPDALLRKVREVLDLP